MSDRRRNDTVIRDLLDRGVITVDPDGTVWREEHKWTNRLPGGQTTTVTVPRHVIAVDRTNNDYCRVRVNDDGNEYVLRIHRIVAMQYLGGLDQEIDHIGGNKANNSVEALRYTTRSGNMIGRTQAKMPRTQAEIDALRERWRNGAPINEIRLELGCGWSTARDLLEGRKHRTNRPSRIYVGDLSLREWSESVGLKYFLIQDRRKKGLSVREAIRSAALSVGLTIDVDALKIDAPQDNN